MKMNKQVRERREFMVQEYNRTQSEKKAIESTSKKFKANKNSLYVDWSRRNNWLNEVVNLKNSCYIIQQLLKEALKTLQEIDKLASEADNDNCRLGALKLRVNVIFKLIDVYRTYDNEELRERIKKLEEMTKRGVFIP